MRESAHFDRVHPRPGSRPLGFIRATPAQERAFPRSLRLFLIERNTPPCNTGGSRATISGATRLAWGVSYGVPTWRSTRRWFEGGSLNARQRLFNAWEGWAELHCEQGVWWVATALRGGLPEIITCLGLQSIPALEKVTEFSVFALGEGSACQPCSRCCLSTHSVTKAGYVHREIRKVLDVADEQPEGTIYVIPLKLEECDVPTRLRRWHWVNFFEPRGFERLMQALLERARALGQTSG